jgi:hypothetical protein
MFWINNDSINAPHEMLIFDVRELYERKHYMSCILNLAQAYEVFFRLYFEVEMLFKTFAADPDLNKLNRLSEELDKKMKKYAFDDMRELFLQHVVKGASPKNLTEAAKYVGRVSKPQKQKKKDMKTAIENIADKKLVALLKAVKKTKIHEIRNCVVHGRAYRPTQDEVEQARNEATDILPALTSRLDLDGDISVYISQADFP